MGIFNTAIQTLSDIAIQESGMSLPEVTTTSLLEDFKTSLDDIPQLSADECRFDIQMVPVRENRRLGKYLIEMEDLSRFMITNGVPSVRDAVGYILEANDLVGMYDKVALVIDEASILDEMDNLGAGVDGEFPEPQPGLGETIFGSQDNFKYLRRIVNTKELLDTLYNKYGLPFVKKNYTQVGLLKEEACIAKERVAATNQYGIKGGSDKVVINGQGRAKKSKNILNCDFDPVGWISGMLGTNTKRHEERIKNDQKIANQANTTKPNAAKPNPPQQQTTTPAATTTTNTAGSAGNTAVVTGPGGDKLHEARIEEIRNLLSW